MARDQTGKVAALDEAVRQLTHDALGTAPHLREEARVEQGDVEARHDRRSQHDRPVADAPLHKRPHLRRVHHGAPDKLTSGPHTAHRMRAPVRERIEHPWHRE